MIRIPKNLTASFDVDAEKCFTTLCPDELPVPGAHLIADELNRQAKFAQLRIGSKDAHSPYAIWVTEKAEEAATPIPNLSNEEINVDLRWKRHGVPGTKGFELLDGLPKPSDYDFFVWKGVELNLHPYGACYHDLHRKLSTGVIEFLRCKQIRLVIIGGIALDFCEGTTALELLDANFRIIVNLAASKGLFPGKVDAMLCELRERGAIIVNDTSELELVGE